MNAMRRSELLSSRQRFASSIRRYVDETGATLKGLAKCAEVSEAKMKNVARGAHGLTFDLASRWPDALFDRLVDELVRERGRGLFPLPEPSEDSVNVIDRFLLTKDSLTQVLVPCTRKRALSPADAAELEPKLRKLQADAQAILEKCSEARSRHGVMLHDDGGDE